MTVQFGALTVKGDADFNSTITEVMANGVLTDTSSTVNAGSDLTVTVATLTAGKDWCAGRAVLIPTPLLSGSVGNTVLFTTASSTEAVATFSGTTYGTKLYSRYALASNLSDFVYSSGGTGLIYLKDMYIDLADSNKIKAIFHNDSATNKTLSVYILWEAWCE